MKKIVSTVLIIFIFTIIGTAVLATTGVVTTNDLNVRDGADTSANKIGTVSKDKELNVLGEEGDWYKIQYNNDVGYVSKDFVELKEESNSTDEDQHKTDQIAENVETSQKLEEKTTLYILPLINSLKLSTLEPGTEITVISNNGKWLYVQTDKESGWITSNKHYSDNTKKVENKKEDSADEANVVEEKNETTNNTVENTTNTTNTTSNETSKNDESDSDDSSYPKTMYLNVNSANIRKSASATAEVISGTAKNDSFKVIGKEGDWYKVSTADGVGYIRSDLLSDKKN